MSFKEKIKAFYQKHKLAIGIAAGVVVTGAALIFAGELLKKPADETPSGQVIFTPNPEPEFPKEMPLAEIKDTIRGRNDDTVLYDALITENSDGSGKLYVREAI